MMMQSQGSSPSPTTLHHRGGIIFPVHSEWTLSGTKTDYGRGCTRGMTIPNTSGHDKPLTIGDIKVRCYKLVSRCCWLWLVVIGLCFVRTYRQLVTLVYPDVS